MEDILNISSPPTAIVCANDSRALHLLQYCKKNRIRVPKDVAVVGFDNIEETNFSHPPLTSVDTMLEKQGEKVLELLLKRKKGILKEPTVVRLKPELVVRESS